ncbi:Terpene synthase, N-terminal domain containing protein [Trema orientale]|uniref:Terpene synthase, N-terminal domain containing protein n=1 Tax=Trema orientale TaxID=63057 RepID=A0A2P5EAS7_TREOI|nr:Terpene synthase, N-terminal domain containing protein [Trema orientale]
MREEYTDIFKSFRDDNGNFKAKASHLAFEGENLLDEAREFTRRHLNDLIKSRDDHQGVISYKFLA